MSSLPKNRVEKGKNDNSAVEKPETTSCQSDEV